MEQGLFRTELRAVVERYGYLLWRRCHLCVDRPELAERIFGLVVLRVSEIGAELRGRDEKLEWLVHVFEAVLESESIRGPGTSLTDSELHFEAWHAGDPDPELAAAIDSSERRARVAALDKARADFRDRVDIQTLLDGVFVDAPLPPPSRSHRGAIVFVAALGLLLALAALWPRADEPTEVPEAFALTAYVERGGQRLKEQGSPLELEGGDDLQVELSIPTAQTVNVFVLEDGGELTPLALGRLFRPGIHRLPQTLHVDPRRRLSARLIAGPPGLVRTATSTGRFEEVSVIRLVSKPPQKK